MNNKARWISGALLWVLVTAPCMGSDAVQAWLERELVNAAEPVSTAGFRVCLEKIYHPAFSEAQLRELAARVADRPDHPERMILEIEERRFRNGSDRYLICCSTLDDDRFRFSTTQVWDRGYSDIGFDGKSAWSLTESQLNIVSPKSAPITKDFISARGVVDVYLSWFFNGGLRFLPAGSVEVVDLGEIESEQYRALLENQEQGWQAEVRFRWDEDLGRGFMASVEYVDASDMDLVGSGYWAEGWAYSDRLDRWVARAVHVRQYGDEFDVAFHGAEVLPESEFGELVGVPDAMGVDPVRGPVTVRAVYDHRPDSEKVVYLNQDRDVQSEVALGEAKQGGLVWTGRAVLVGCLFVALGVYLLRMRS